MLKNLWLHVQQVWKLQQFEITYTDLMNLRSSELILFNYLWWAFGNYLLLILEKYIIILIGIGPHTMPPPPFQTLENTLVRLDKFKQNGILIQ